jgi:sugar O-acyltransferase (sialic acid O-acetyltransferase NeuD family)
VIISVLDALGFPIGGLYDSDPTLIGTRVGNYRVLGDLPPNLEHIEGTFVLAIGQNTIRQKLAHRLEGHVKWVPALVHPTAMVDPSVQLGVGTVVFAGAIVQPDTVVGDHTIINTAATVDHDGEIGDFVHLAPGVHLAGGVQVGTGAFLGIGASVIPTLRLGEWSTVGAGGVVVRDLPSRVTAVGVPARIISTQHL